MCLFFHAWHGNADGLDLTVTLINTAETHDITVQPAAVGGSATASPVSACACTSVSITATPDAGYLPNGFVVTDSKGHNIPVDGGWYSSNTGSFKMPLWWFKLSVKFIAPIVLLGFCCWNIYNNHFASGTGIYGGYPLWSNIVAGWGITVLAFISGPIVQAVYKKVKKGAKEPEFDWKD